MIMVKKKKEEEGGEKNLKFLYFDIFYDCTLVHQNSTGVSSPSRSAISYEYVACVSYYIHKGFLLIKDMKISTT